MRFIQQAYRGNNEWWAYILTLFFVFIGWQIIGVIPLMVVAFQKAGDWATFMEAGQNAFAGLGIDSNLYLFLAIFSFFVGLLGLILGVKAIHRRKLISIVTSREKVDWQRIMYAFFVWAGIGLALMAIGYFLAPEDFIWNFKPKKFVVLVVVSLLFLPLQTTMEELLFRGYLLQGFGSWFRRTFPALLVSSAIFGLLHGMNPEVAKLGWITMIYYIGTGFILGIFTLMDEGAELAIGFHASNNILAALIITSDWMVFQTDALLIDTSEPSVGWEMIMPVVLIYPLVLYIFSKKYRWTNWNEKLFGIVDKPVLEEDKFIA